MFLLEFQADKEAIESEIGRRKRIDAMPRGAAGSLTDLNELRTRYTVGEVLSRLTGRPEKLGRKRFITHCPFHADKHPSLSVNETLGLFHCFSCGAGGDMFKLVMLVRKCEFKEALEWLKA
jgi:DNA primase